MKKIILITSLFFCLTITTILAQVVTTNIAAPDSNGFSNNQVSDFDVNSDGTILNNSAASGTATLGSTAVTANSNITAGSEANLILLQVTGTDVSDLDGTIEVFGTEAGLIIANPNGIDCDGCGFTNVNRVDLVTGSGYDADTNRFSTIAAADIDITSSGLTAPVLKVQTGADFNNAGAIVADTVTIEVTNFANDIANTGTVSATSLNFILTDDFTYNSTSFTDFNNFSNLAITTEGTFTNNDTIDLADNLTITANSFDNTGGTMSSDTLALSVAGDWNYLASYVGSIYTNAFNLNVGGDFSFNLGHGVFSIRANDIYTVSGSANITLASFNIIGNIDVNNSFNVNAASFNNSGTITVTNSFNATVDTFINQAGATISAFGNCNIVSNSYTDDGTITCLDFAGDAMVIDIAAPDANGLSDNQVDSFDVNARSTILNNSADGGTAQLGNTAVTAHPNISAGSEASLILFQVTGSSGSALNGTIEVFGAKAGLIIANPNGIVCTGCAFINANRLDLVTGKYDLNTNTFGDIAATNITLGGSSLVLDVLNIQTGANFNNAGTINANNLNIIAGADFSNSATINADTVTIEVTDFSDDITNTSTVSSASLNFIITDSFTHNSTSFSGFTNFSNLAITTDGTFTNTATINPTGNTVITANTFINTGGVVNTGTFALSVDGDFDYGTITANTYNLNVGGDFSYNDSASNLDWGDNDILTVSGTANIVAADFENSGTITVTNSNLNLTATNFTNTGTISANSSLNLTATNFTNSGTISANTTLNTTVTSTTGSFNNTGGEIEADTFALSVARDFDYVADYLNNGTITADTITLNVGGDFSNNDANNDFTWGENDSLTVSGSASVVAAGFANSGAITISNSSFDITATDFTNSGTITITNSGNFTANTFSNAGGELNAATVDLSVAGDFDYDEGTITANALNLDVGGNFSYDDSANNLDWRATDTLTVSGNASINAASFSNSSTITVKNSFDIIAAADFTNSGTINVTNSFDIMAAADFDNSGAIAVTNSSFDITATDFTNSGTITANSFNATVDDFSNEIDAMITAGECNIVFHTSSSDNGTITCLNEGDAVVFEIAEPTNGLSRNDYTDFDIPINGVVFNNSLFDATSQLVAGSILANTNYGAGNAASIILAEVSGTRSLLFGALEVVGAKAVVIIANPNGITCNGCSFINASRVDLVTGSDYNSTNDSFDIIANTNIAIIENGLDASSSGILNIHAGGFTNTSVLKAKIFNLNVVGDFDYANIGTINATSFNLNVGGDFSNNDASSDFTWGANDTLTVSGNADIVAASFNNSGTINVTNIFDITETNFTNAGTITANTLNTTFTASNSFSNVGVLNAATFNLDVAGAFDYLADYLNNGTITTNALNLNVGGDFSYNNLANDLDWRATDKLTVSGSVNITAASFNNSGTIDVDNSFNATVATFSNQSGATITAAECNLVNTTSYTDNGTITCQSLNFEGDEIVSFNIAGPNNGLSSNSYPDFNIPINGVIFNNSVVAASIILAQVTGTNMSLLAGALEVVGAEAVVIIANPNGIDCDGCSFINASRVDLVTGSSYNRTNDSFNNITNGNIAIADNGLNASSSDILNIHAGSFTNTGVLNANIFNLFVDDFDYSDKGTLTTTAFNLEVADVFSYEDESIGFVWEANESLTVLGTANITTNNFINHGAIDIAGSGSFEIAVDYTAINQGSIVSENGSLNITTYDFFRNLTGGDIAVNSLNIIAGGKVTNTATIDVATLTITASDDSSRTNDRTGFYVSNRGNITATTLNITAVDNFYNRGNITATNFNITRAKDIFFLNKEIDSYDGTYDGGNISLNGDSSFRADGDIIENYGNIISLNGDSNFIADGGSIQNYGHISLTGDSSFIADGIIENYGHIISLNGNSSFIADGGSIQNYGHIDLGNNILDISADSFTNHADATIDADTLNLAVSSYINDGTVDVAVINDGSIIDTTSDQ